MKTWGCFYVVCICFLFFLSCNNNDAIKKISLTDPELLESINVHVDVDLYRPSKMVLNKSDLIIFDDQNADIFKVFELSGLSYKYSFGSIGQGPGEFKFLDKESIDFSDYLKIIDLNKMYSISISDSMSKIEKETYLTEVFDTPVNSLKFINDSLCVLNNSNQKNNSEYLGFNMIDKKIEYVGKTPEWSSTVKFSNTKLQYSKSICVNKQTARTAIFYYNYPNFRIYSKENELLGTFEIDTEANVNNENIYFTESYATDDYIYVMWVNKSKKEVEKDIENFNPEILVFDWDGSLVDHYRLSIPAITFAVWDNYLYAVSFIDANTIYKYQLNPGKLSQGVYKKISNGYYNFDMFENFNLPSPKSHFDSNKKYKCNVMYLAQGFENRKYTELGSARIVTYFRENVDLNMDSLLIYMKEVSENNNTLTYENFPSFMVNGKEVRYVVSTSEGMDPKEGSYTSYQHDYLFYINDEIIWFQISTRNEDFSLYEKNIKEIIGSFSPV